MWFRKYRSKYETTIAVRRSQLPYQLTITHYLICNSFPSSLSLVGYCLLDWPSQFKSDECFKEPLKSWSGVNYNLSPHKTTPIWKGCPPFCLLHRDEGCFTSTTWKGFKFTLIMDFNCIKLNFKFIFSKRYLTSLFSPSP